MDEGGNHVWVQRLASQGSGFNVSVLLSSQSHNNNNNKGIQQGKALLGCETGAGARALFGMHRGGCATHLAVRLNVKREWTCKVEANDLAGGVHRACRVQLGALDASKTHA